MADRISIWPLDDGRYGLDATFQGAIGFERASEHERALKAAPISYSFKQELGGAWTLRFGPLTAADVARALQQFLV